MPERPRAVVGVVDYHSGNIRSVVSALESTGARTRLVRHPGDTKACSHLVLPGVGAFGFCADQLRTSGLLAGLQQWALEEKRPLLGICVGMQLMADSSDELGSHKGLGWIGGFVTRIRQESSEAGVRVPHVGWNNVEFGESFGQFNVGDSVDFYFDHSYAYHAPNPGREIASVHHGQSFCAMVRRENVVAVQFHPEKSQAAGMRLLESFLAT